MRICRWKDGRSWAVYDEAGDLVVVTLYKRGAEEVARRLSGSDPKDTGSSPVRSLARSGS